PVRLSSRPRNSLGLPASEAGPSAPACEGRMRSMDEAPSAPGAEMRGRERSTGDAQHYAALDLGTNNCRLLIATPAGGGFRVVEAYSRIVRLGEGLGQSGRLSDAAMDR